jgi:RsiW-degrading membrane proteinase PrsW (M82 family)
MLANYISFIEKYPFVLAFLLGLIPALVWLWFWLKEDVHPESAKMLTLSFLGGMLAVVLVLPLQTLVYKIISNENYLSFFLWASLEEIFKFGTVWFVALRGRENDEPVDSIIYMIVSALGFVALENTFFLMDLIRAGDFYGVFITGNLRFVGSSLLHIVSSGTVGVFMALSFYKNRSRKILYTVCGLFVAIVLHTLFNIYIMNVPDNGILFVFGAVWVGIVALLLLFEKIKNTKIDKSNEFQNKI